MTYQRKTYDEYQIHQFYPYTNKWEEVSTYKTRYEAKVDLKSYRENQPEFPVKIIKRRIKLFDK